MNINFVFEQVLEKIAPYKSGIGGKITIANIFASFNQRKAGL